MLKMTKINNRRDMFVLETKLISNSKIQISYLDKIKDGCSSKVQNWLQNPETCILSSKSERIIQDVC